MNENLVKFALGRCNIEDLTAKDSLAPLPEAINARLDEIGATPRDRSTIAAFAEFLKDAPAHPKANAKL